MKRNILSALFLIAILGGILWVYKGDILKQNSSSLSLPLPVDSKSVETASVFYTVHGKITNIKKLDNNTREIELDTADKNMPRLVITSSTELFAPGTVKSVVRKKITLNDVMIGKNVQVYLWYKLAPSSNNPWRISTLFVKN